MVSLIGKVKQVQPTIKLHVPIMIKDNDTCTMI